MEIERDQGVIEPRGNNKIKAYFAKDIERYLQNNPNESQTSLAIKLNKNKAQISRYINQRNLATPSTLLNFYFIFFQTNNPTDVLSNIKCPATKGYISINCIPNKVSGTDFIKREIIEKIAQTNIEAIELLFLLTETVSPTIEDVMLNFPRRGSELLKILSNSGAVEIKNNLVQPKSRVVDFNGRIPLVREVAALMLKKTSSLNSGKCMNKVSAYYYKIKQDMIKDMEIFLNKQEKERIDYLQSIEARLEEDGEIFFYQSSRTSVPGLQKHFEETIQ